jgi:TolB-like protein/Tfp pilus assembly protein PilF
VTEPSHAVFLSYASQDAEPARKICEALRAAGIEVFFDQSELRGGDAWDQKIRKKIHDCALFVPIVSLHTQERLEGYFRHEWKLAIERTHHMAEQKPFLVPVVIDGTRDQEALIPDAFRAVQWTRMPGGDTPPAFVERIRRLLSPELSPGSGVSGAAPAIREPVRATRRPKPVLLAIVAVVVCAALAYLVANRFWVSRHSATSAGDTASRATAEPAAAAFYPPPHSIAVLPFVNMSGDKEQEYFSDGLTEELLNSLSRINELQVAARTSSFSFQGQHPDIATVAHKLNVAAVLEGSVRRSAHTVRITAQLINAVTGFHLWSQTYDRNLGDVLLLQTDIANAVAGALKVTLLADVAAKVEIGGTRHPGAFDAYLRAAKAAGTRHSEADEQLAIADFSEAIRLDPSYALAFAGRSRAFAGASEFATAAIRQEEFARAEADAQRAIELAPALADGHVALAVVYEDADLDFPRASEEYAHAAELAPGNANAQRANGRFAVYMGRTAAGIQAARRAVVLDPLNHVSHYVLGLALFSARQYEDAIAAQEDSLALDPDDPIAHAVRGFANYALGNLPSARSSCEIKPDYWASQLCLAVTYERLGQHAAAKAMLAKLQAANGDGAAYQYAEVYAQWGDSFQALQWLDTALHLRDPGLVELKSDPLLDPLRREPRFQAIERELKFPD